MPSESDPTSMRADLAGAREGAGRWAPLPDLVALGATAICGLLSFGLSLIESRTELDPHHWGLMFANAQDLAHGAEPYRDFHVPYGFLTTLIQSVALRLGHEPVVSVGAVTGACYSFSILLAFFIWRRIMGPWLAGLSAVLMFLVHPYIASPWANYFACLFVLVSVLLLMRSGRLAALGAGVAIGLSFLARESSITSTLAAVGAFLLYSLLREDDAAGRRQVVQRALLVTLGFLVVTVGFFAWLAHRGTLGDWRTLSSRTLDFYWRYFGGRRQVIERTAMGFLLGRGWGDVFELRMLIYSFVFLAAAVCSIDVLRALRQRAAGLPHARTFLIAAVTLTGIVQAGQSYEVWRLHCACSLGLGLLLASLKPIAARLNVHQRMALTAGGLLVFLHLTASMAFTRTTASYQIWSHEQVAAGLRGSKDLGWPGNVPMFRGMWMDRGEVAYYQVLAATLDSCGAHLPNLVNLSYDGFVPLLSPSLRRVQRCPYYIEAYSKAVYPEDLAVMDSLIRAGRTVVVVNGVQRVPAGYVIVRQLLIPPHTYHFGEHVEYMVVAMPRPHG